jgi:hypothetical protein
MEETQENPDMENMMPLPLVEMKYIEWKYDSSDEEGFKVVSKKRSRKKGRKPRTTSAKEARGAGSHPPDEIPPSEGGSTRHCTKYNLRKGVAWHKT